MRISRTPLWPLLNAKTSGQELGHNLELMKEKYLLWLEVYIILKVQALHYANDVARLVFLCVVLSSTYSEYYDIVRFSCGYFLLSYLIMHT